MNKEMKIRFWMDVYVSYIRSAGRGCYTVEGLRREATCVADDALETLELKEKAGGFE